MKGSWRINARASKRAQIANHCVVEWRPKYADHAEVDGIKVGPCCCNKTLGHNGKHRCACGARRD